MKWSLVLTLAGPFGERYSMAVDLTADIAQEISRIDPPTLLAPFENSFEYTVTKLKRKEFRKKLFTQESERLGTLLAERMEDAEGWHDIERIEAAKQQLRGKQ